MTTEAGFLRAIEAGDDSADLLRVYADWLDERGRRDQAYALRWMAARDRRPGLRKRMRLADRWFWCCEGADTDLARRGRHELARDVMRNPRAVLPFWAFIAAASGLRSSPVVACPSLDAAVGELAVGLRHLRIDAAIDPLRLE